MAHNPHHVHLIREMAEMFEPIFSKSPQAIYLYLDDEHKICNKKFAQLLGYSSPQQWVDNLYPVDDVSKEDQEKAINAYMDASRRCKASTLSVTWKAKNGKKVPTVVILAPIFYQGEVFVLHFISKKTK